MKKYLFILLATVCMLASCSNDDIEVIKSASVQVKVSLSNFYQSYNYNDTKHDRKISDLYRVFHSENNKYIQIRTFFYNSENGELVHSIVKYVTDTNDLVENVELKTGTYTVVTTLCFADGTSEDYAWWSVEDEDNITTARLVPYTRYSMWSILSEEEKTLVVEYGKVANFVSTPKPVGSLIYVYCQNFQYKSKQYYPTVSDNKIRQMNLFSQKIASEYKIDPMGTSRYNYLEDPGSNTWYWMSQPIIPSSVNKDWTFFQSNIYDFCFALAPEFNMIFGYILEGEDTFNGYGQANYTIENGQIYLAYWDWFQVGNPYFGKADNSHWHTYSTSAKSEDGVSLGFESSVDVSVSKIIR